MVDYRKLTAALICGTLLVFPLAGCGLDKTNTSAQESASAVSGNAVSASLDTEVDAESLELEFDDEDLVTAWDNSQACNITLSQTGSSVSGSGASVSGSTVTITAAGTYVISGSLTDGGICVNTQDKATVKIILNGVNVTSTSNAAFLIEDAKKVIVTLADNTVNTFTDSGRAATESEDYSAAVYSKADLVFNGNGTLEVNAGYRNGIKSSDDLKIVSGVFKVTAIEDGIIGKDLLGIAGGSFTVKAEADGMKSTYDTDTSKGNIIIRDGVFQINSGNDGIQAENMLSVEGGTINITTGSGSASVTMTSGQEFGMGRGGMLGNTRSTTAAENDSESLKGLKASNAVYISGGTVNIDSEDDGVHTNNFAYISGGSITIKSGDDGIHADSKLQIGGGKVDIQYSYEGLEAAEIVTDDGEILISSEDDGMNASNGTTQSMGGGFKMETVSNGASTPTLTINGGNIYVEADGDGLDSNGIITVNGGYVIVSGPVSSGNTAVDFDSQCVLNGGVLMAFGSNGMIETPTAASNGSCIVMTFTSQQAGTEFTLSDSSGNVIMSYTPEKAYSAAILYSSDIKTSQTYTALTGSVSQSVEVNSSVTTAGSSSGMGGMNGGGMNGGGMNGGQMNGAGRGEGAGGGKQWNQNQAPNGGTTNF